MLSTELYTFLGVFCLLVSIFCIISAYYIIKLAHYCRAAVEYVEKHNKNAVSLRKLTELEVGVTDLWDSHATLLKSHKTLRSRIGMRELREQRENGVDSISDGDRLTPKEKLRLQAKAAKLI